jgi:hypothetical protein
MASMIVITWEFRVQPGQAAEFERAHGCYDYHALDTVCEPLRARNGSIGRFTCTSSCSTSTAP